MQCLICGKESAGEVCNQCIRAEQVMFTKEWTYKEGLLKKKTEDFKLAISNARISGCSVISTSPNGMNAKIDNFNHYIGGVLETGECTYSGKPAPLIHVKTSTGMERYLIFPQLANEIEMKAVLQKAKSEIMGAGSAAGAGSGSGSDPDAAQKLSKLNLLKANGILTEEEYQKEKLKLGL